MGEIIMQHYLTGLIFFILSCLFAMAAVAVPSIPVTANQHRINITQAEALRVRESRTHHA
jgi:hypothetical protein